MLVHPDNIPRAGRHFEAMLVWMDEKPLDSSLNFFFKHTTKTTKVRIDKIRYKINVNSLRKTETENLQLNEIGRVVLTTSTPIFFDPYLKNRQTGSFIIIDPLTNNTSAVGMIIDRVASNQLPSRITSPDTATRPGRSLITSAERQTKMKQKGATIWITGLHASGKNELAYALERKLFDLGQTVVVLDGAAVRTGLSRELDFNPADRAEHLRRVAETAKILNDHGILVIAVFISPRRSIRAQLAEIIGRERFLEIHAQASLDWCRQHDVTGLFAKAEQGNLRFVPGIDIPYEKPQTPDLTIPMETMTPAVAAERLVQLLNEKDFIDPYSD